MFGSMPWCSFPGYNFFRVNALLYSSLNMIDEFTSLFRQRQLLRVRLGQLSHRSMPLWTSVFFRRWASNSLDSPKCYFQLKELDIKNSIEPLKLLSQWLKSGEGCIPTWANLCPYLPAWANIAVGQLCRERQPLWNSHDSWWPELKIFGSMPWCSFPFQNLLPCHTTAWIWSVSLQLFTSVFKTKPDLCKDRHWTSVFFRRWASNSQDSPKGYLQLKELDIKNLIEPPKLLSQWMKSGEGCIPTCANLCPYVPTWANIAVCQLCRERQPLWNSHDSWWPELKIFGSRPWCSFPWQKLLAGGKELLYSLSLIHDFVSWRWWIQVCLGKLSHGSMPL